MDIGPGDAVICINAGEWAEYIKNGSIYFVHSISPTAEFIRLIGIGVWNEWGAPGFDYYRFAPYQGPEQKELGLDVKVPSHAG